MVLSLSNDLDGINSKFLLLNKNIISYKDAVAALKTGGSLGLSNARATGITEKDIVNLEAYNNALRQGKNPMSAYYSTMMDSSNAAKQLATDAKGAEVNTRNLTVTTKASTVAMVGARIATVAFQTVLSFGLGFAIQGVIKGLDYLIHYQEKQAEAAHEQAQKSQETADKAKEEAKTLDELIAKYKELKSADYINENGRAQIRDIQKEITKLVGDQANNLDLVNGNLDTELEKLKGISKEQAKQNLDKYRTAASDEMAKGIKGDDEYDTITHGNVQVKADASKLNDKVMEYIYDVFAKAYNDNNKHQVPRVNDTEPNGRRKVYDARGRFQGDYGGIVYRDTNWDNIEISMDGLSYAVRTKTIQQVLDYLEENLDDVNNSGLYKELSRYKSTLTTGIQENQDKLENFVLDYLHAGDYSDERIKSLGEYKFLRQTIIDDLTKDSTIQEALKKGFVDEEWIANQADNYLGGLSQFKTYNEQFVKEQTQSADNLNNVIDTTTEKVDRFKELMDEKGTDKNPSFVEGIEKSVEQIQKLEDALAKFESGTLTDKEKMSLFKAFPQLTAYADNLGAGIRNLLGEMRGDIVTQFTDKIVEFKKAGATDEEIAQLKAYEQTILNIADSVDSVKNALDSVKSVFIDLDSVIKDYNENQYFSLESLEKLSENGQRYLSYLSYENGQLKINEEAYKKLVLAQIDEIETKATLQATTDLQSLTDETAAKKYLAKVNIDLAQSQLTAAQAAFQYQLALKLAEGGNIAKAAQKVADNLNSLRNIFASARGQVDDYAAAMLGATSATEKKAKASEKAKSALESEQRALEHSKKALENEKKALEDNKNEHEKAQKAIEDLIKWTQDYIKQIKEDEVETLEEAQKKFDESIEKQKESLQEKKQALLDTLEAEKDLHDFERTIGEKNNDLAKKALSVAILSLDDSSSGQKAYKEKQEEYKKSQSDLQDYLYDYSIEKRKEAIEKEASIQEKHLDELQNLTDKSYERQIESIQDYLADEVRLYRDACSMIDNDNGELYGKLLSYCLTYTTTGRTEFDNMWSLAQTAMEKYNVANIGTMQFMDEIKGRIYDIDDAIDTISNNIETYENRISDVKNQLDNLKEAAVEAKNAIDAANSTPLIGDVPNTPNKTTDNSNNGMRYIGRGYDAAKGQYYYEISYRGRDYWSYVGDSSDTDRVRNLAALGITKEIAKYHNGFDTYGLSQVQHALNVDVKNIKHYATGTRSTPSAFISQEKGLEAIFAKNPNGSGSYTLTTPDSQVFDHKRTDELYDFSGDPSKYIKNNLVPLTKDELNKFGAWGNALQLLDKDIIGDSILSGMVEKIVGSVPVPTNNTTNNMATNVNITIQGDATQSTVNALRAEADNIIKRTINQMIKIPIRNKFVI